MNSFIKTILKHLNNNWGWWLAFALITLFWEEGGWWFIYMAVGFCIMDVLCPEKKSKGYLSL
jgi:hypothetical protein